MLRFLAIFFLIILVPLSALPQKKNRNIKKKLKKVNSYEDARKFKNDHPEFSVQIFTLNSLQDTSEQTKNILAKKVGSVFVKNEMTYKVIEKEKDTASRVSYIYFDGSDLNLDSINSLRTQIIAQLKRGANFVSLVKKYTMDGNPTGDLGWFTGGMMVAEFEAAVLKHNVGDIFTVDILQNNWFYVVKKSFDETPCLVMKIIMVNTKKKK